MSLIAKDLTAFPGALQVTQTFQGLYDSEIDRRRRMDPGTSSCSGRVSGQFPLTIVLLMNLSQ